MATPTIPTGDLLFSLPSLDILLSLAEVPDTRQKKLQQRNSKLLHEMEKNTEMAKNAKPLAIETKNNKTRVNYRKQN